MYSKKEIAWSASIVVVAIVAVVYLFLFLAFAQPSHGQKAGPFNGMPQQADPKSAEPKEIEPAARFMLLPYRGEPYGRPKLQQVDLFEQIRKTDQLPELEGIHTPDAVDRIREERKKEPKVAPRPEQKKKPHWLWKPWRFQDRNTRQLWYAMVPAAIGIALDGHSTALVQRRRPGSVELNPFLPDHPTPRRLAIHLSAYFVGQLYATSWMQSYGQGIVEDEPNLPRSQRIFFGSVAWRSYPFAIGMIHGVWAARQNYSYVTCPGGYYKPIGKPGCVAR